MVVSEEQGGRGKDIRNEIHTYHVKEGGHRTEIYVTADGHLQTEADDTTANNLDNLPDC